MMSEYQFRPLEDGEYQVMSIEDWPDEVPPPPGAVPVASRRDKVRYACEGLVSDQARLDLWMGYYDMFWVTAGLAYTLPFDAKMFLQHSWDHEYFETDDFEHSRAIFLARLGDA